jgi:hypothetical protein
LTSRTWVNLGEKWDGYTQLHSAGSKGRPIKVLRRWLIEGGVEEKILSNRECHALEKVRKSPLYRKTLSKAGKGTEREWIRRRCHVPALCHIEVVR